MLKKYVQAVLGALVVAVVGYPLSVWYGGVSLMVGPTLLAELFPAFGLLAATVMYLHIIGRPFSNTLEQYVPFTVFERLSSYLVLVAMLLHVVLRAAFFVMQGISLVPPPAYMLPLGLGFVGLLLLLTYDVGKYFITNPWVVRHWLAIDVASTLGFYVIWLHAFLIGHTVAVEPMRTVWIVYGATALAASAVVALRALRTR